MQPFTSSEASTFQIFMHYKSIEFKDSSFFGDTHYAPHVVALSVPSDEKVGTTSITCLYAPPVCRALAPAARREKY